MINDMTFEDVGKLLDLSPNATCGYVRVTFVRQKQKLRIADANAIAVLETSTPDRHVVNKRAVEAFEIRDYEPGFVFFDLRVTTRN